MNQQEVEQLFLEARSIRLSDEAKYSGRQALMRRMASEESKPLAPRFAWLGQSWLRAGGFASALLLIGSTAWAAETALPGDTLYSWKTGLNEPVRLALLPTTVARAEWSVELFARRLDEAEALASAGTLSDEAQQLLEEKLNEERERADTYGRSIGGAEENRIETEMQERSEKVTHIEVREHEGRLRIRVREEHEEYESEAEKRREHEVHDEDGWIEEAELHENSSGQDVESKNEEDEVDRVTAVPQALSKVTVKKQSVSSESQSFNSEPKETTSVVGSVAQKAPVTENSDEDDVEKNSDLMSESEARFKALAAVPGTIKESELKDEDDDSVWQVVIRRSVDDQEVKVIVDAQSGVVKKIED